MKKALLLSVLAIALLAGIASFASAGTATFADNIPGTVNVKAAVNSKLVLSVVTTDTVAQTVDFGAVDPGSSYSGPSVGLNVKSNKKYTLTAVKTDATPIGLATTLAPSTVTAVKSIAGGDPYTDNYSLVVPANCAPGAQTATVVYTATQN